ncbi:MAG: hypothetical protein WC829_06950 [Hyphomicrobium sp.]|jgi:hypothetical protein
MTWVTLGTRRFLVDFDDAGEPVRIKERKVLHAGHPYLEHIYNAPYWSAKHHGIGGPKTLVSRILEEAKKGDHAV